MQRFVRPALAAWLAAALLANPALCADSKPAAPRVINVTPDSQQGWVPSVELEKQARQAAIGYLAAMDGGKYADTYAMVADINRTDQPFPVFAARARDFNAKAGAALERRITTVTWTKDSPAAPLPGVFVVLDLVSKFAKVNRHCGYLMLYQPPTGGDFKVTREESNFIDNATFASLSKEKADAAWIELSAHCPGYKEPLPEIQGDAIGYPSVEAALAGLHAKPGVTFREEKGWTIAEDNREFTIWSFPPKGHPAYPSAVKRQFVSDANGTSLTMQVHCQASKEACDDLVRTFQKLNTQMEAFARGRH